MICTTKEQAERVAQAGFEKMTEGEYDLFEPFGDSTAYYLAKSDGETFYRIDPQTEGYSPFFKDNEQFGVCKHTLYIHDHCSTQATIEAEEAREADRQMYAGW